jgi:hypothetical protein
LVAAADSLEAARSLLVSRNYFRSYDNNIWVFTAIIRCICRQSPETETPPAYQRFFDALPSTCNENMTCPQLEFWYGSPDEKVGGEIQLISAQESAKKEDAKVVSLQPHRMVQTLHQK